MPDSPRPVVAKVGDRFFSDVQLSRLKQLMATWRAARDSGTEFPAADLAELDALIAAELDATIERTKELLRQKQTGDLRMSNTAPDQPGV